METLLANIKIAVNENIYLKDPETSTLGRKVIAGSICMINEIGFEDYTFRKLAKEIDSTEASVYRYFENKHKLLLYLTSWYWTWMEYRMVFSLANINSPHERLEQAILLFTQKEMAAKQYDHINTDQLYNIVIAESSKVYLTKYVDQENESGLFGGYKKLVDRVSQIILEINPSYKYPHMLVSTVIEGAHHQRYFADHLPRLTDAVKGEDAVINFFKNLVFKTISA